MKLWLTFGVVLAAVPAQAQSALPTGQDTGVVLRRALEISAWSMLAIFVFMSLFWVSTLVLMRLLPAKSGEK